MLNLLLNPLSAMSISPVRSSMNSIVGLLAPRLTRMQGESHWSPHSERAASLNGIDTVLQFSFCNSAHAISELRTLAYASYIPQKHVQP